MRTIGITGGVGCGKSAVIKYIEDHYNARIIFADNLAYELESPGHECYDDIVALLGREILDEDGCIDKHAMAAKIFADPDLLLQVNGIIHPAVKRYILRAIDEEKTAGRYDLFVLEAALLIEEKYYEILDELWYVRCDADIRRGRLKTTRGYSDEKIDQIMSSQCDDETFIRYCAHVIDNNGSLEEAYAQVDALLSDLTALEET
ncbi:dephospho-CoA kinase [Lachnospiraceae bacterium XBB2008]|nr:dephospho-CoA kinase [Lachnospiraceae bacterium XBB2008]